MEKELIAYIDSRIGIPYLVNGRDPQEGLDCFGLVADYFENYLNIKLTDDIETLPLNWQTNPEYENYKKQILQNHGKFVPKPTKHCIVYMSTDRSNLVDHIGIYVGEDRVLNAGKYGVRLDRLMRLQEANMVRGYVVVER